MFQIPIFILIFLTGLIVGSFLNCVIYRLYSEESFLKSRPRRKTFSFLRGRSFCPNCKHILTWQDLIPVLSFLILKGKCRYCRKPISLQYPLVELATAILFFLIWQTAAFELRGFLFYSLITSFLIIIFVFDLKHYLIPDKVIYPAIAITFLYRMFGILDFGHWDLFGNWKLEIGNLQPLLNPLISAILASTFFLLIVSISRGKWMGFGDFKLAFLIGLFLGWPNILVALFLAFFIGAIIGVGLIIFGKKTLKSEIPFGPFLVTGTFLAMLFGQKILDWYLNLFLPR